MASVSLPQCHSLSSSSTLRNAINPSHFKLNSPISFSFPNIQLDQTLTRYSNGKSLIAHSSNGKSLIAQSSPTSAAAPRPSLKSRLKNGETLNGIFLFSFCPTVAEIAGLAGYDFAVVDMEHGPGGVHAALPCLHALAATGTAAILRLPECSSSWAKKALDIGPQGIMFSMIDSPKSARKAVSYCRFPPDGVRGSAHTLVRASAYGMNEGYLSNYKEELLIMCQVESEEGLKNIEEIAAVEGVDCIQMGPRDLSASLGYLWDPAHKKVKEVLVGGEKAVLKGGEAFLSGVAMPHDGAVELRRRGYHMVVGTSDVALFRSAAVEDVRKFKMSSVEKLSENGAVPVEAEKYWSKVLV